MNIFSKQVAAITRAYAFQTENSKPKENFESTTKSRLLELFTSCTPANHVNSYET